MTTAALIAVLGPLLVPILSQLGIGGPLAIALLKVLVPLGLDLAHVGTLKVSLNKPLTEKERAAVTRKRARDEEWYGRSGFG